MRKLAVQVNVSLDGFADHTVAVADDELHDFFAGLLDDTDIELFGRRTYELMAGYWPRAHEDPAATPGMLRFAGKFNALPKIVFSRTLPAAGWNNTRLVRTDAADEVSRLKREPGRNLAVGGIELCQSFMRLGLIDEYWILVHPVLAGQGRRLFASFEHAVSLRLLQTRTFASGVVVLHYAVG